MPTLANSIRVIAATAAAISFFCLTGCNAGRISDENTRLRRENYDLTQQLAAMKADVERRQAQIAALEKQATLPKPAIDGVRLADLPVVTKLEFGGYSGVYDSNGDGSDDTVRVYLQPLDQRGRFYPAVGKAVLQAVVIEAGKPPAEVATREFSVKDLDAAYVAGFTGTHFTLETKLPANPPKELTIKVTFTDAQTGAVITQQMNTKVNAK